MEHNIILYHGSRQIVERPEIRIAKFRVRLFGHWQNLRSLHTKSAFIPQMHYQH